jgi:hypothetical protein
MIIIAGHELVSAKDRNKYGFSLRGLVAPRGA